MKTSKLYIISIIIVLASCKQQQAKVNLPFYNTPDFTPQWFGSTVGKQVHTIAPFSFINQSGETITNKQVTGKIYVASFFFSRCTSICPKMNTNLKKVQQAFSSDDDVLLLSHSVTPETDSVPKLAAFARVNEIDGRNWWLLTGDKEAIYTLARKSYFADEETGYNSGTDEFLHTENFILVDRHGRIRGVYNGTLELEVNKLIEHIKILKEEPAQ